MRHAPSYLDWSPQVLLIALACLFAGANGALADLNDGLVGYWSLDEDGGSTAYDYSGHGNHGIIDGAIWAVGISGSALEFDGVDDHVQVPNNPSLNPGSVSVALWFNGHVKSETYSYAYLVSKWKWNGVPDGSGYRIKVHDSGVAVWMIGLGDGTWYGTYMPYQEHIWQHTVGTYESSAGTMKVYLDGELQATRCIPVTPVPFTSTDLLMDSFHAFDGIMDEVRIYDRALSPDEVLDLYWSVNPDPQEDTTEGDQSDTSGTSADPVNTATGSFFHQETDLSIPSRGSPLIFTRYYNSKAAAPGRKAAKSNRTSETGSKTATPQPASTKQGKPSSADAKKHDEPPPGKDQGQAAGSSQPRPKTEDRK